MKIVHAADLHLGSPLGGLDRHAALPVARIRRAPMDAFERLADLCERESADLLLVAGDLFDGDAPLSVVGEAVAVLRRIVGAGTRVVTLRGNHDASQRMQRHLPRLEGLRELSSSAPETVDLPELGVAVHGRGFDEQHVPDNIVRSYPARIEGRVNVGMLHTSLEGNATHAVYAPCSVADLTAHGYDYWALGHIHQHGIVAREPWVVYAGSPQGRHVNERGEFGAYVVEVAGGAIVGEPRHVPLASVHWHHVEVEVDEDDDARPDAIVDRAAAALAEVAGEHGASDLHVVRLTITGRSATHAALARDPDMWRDQLHLAAQAVTAADVALERVRLDVRPALPDAAVLHERSDYVGRFALHLDAERLLWREGPGEGPPIDPPDQLAVLDRRLDALGADAVSLRAGEVTADELELATEQLLSRLVAASTAAAEEAGR